MKRGQSLRPLELLLFIGIFFFSAMLLMLYSGAQNSTHSSQIEAASTTIGGTRALTEMLEHTVNGSTILDRIVQNNVEVGTDIETYMRTYEPSILRYRVLRNGDELIETSDAPDDPVQITLEYKSVNITWEYEK